MLFHSALLCALLLLSACGSKDQCSYYGNCGCTDWYNKCSVH